MTSCALPTPGQVEPELHRLRAVAAGQLDLALTQTRIAALPVPAMLT